MYFLTITLSILALSFLVSAPRQPPPLPSNLIHLTSSPVPRQPSQTPHQCHHPRLSQQNRAPRIPRPKKHRTLPHRSQNPNQKNRACFPKSVFIFMSVIGVLLGCADIEFT